MLYVLLCLIVDDTYRSGIRRILVDTSPISGAVFRMCAAPEIGVVSLAMDREVLGLQLAAS